MIVYLVSFARITDAPTTPGDPMPVSLTVLIGSNKHSLGLLDLNNPLVVALLEGALSVNGKLTATLPSGLLSKRVAEALGQLHFSEIGLETCGPEPTEPESAPASPEPPVPLDPAKLLKAYETPIKELGLEEGLEKRLKDYGQEYAWQIAEKSMTEIRKMKGIGAIKADRIVRALEKIGLSLGMKIGRELKLPLPPHH